MPQECYTISRRADTGDYGTHTFTTSNPSFLARDSNGSFSAQVTYNASMPVAFGFVIAGHLYGLAAGPVTANVDEFVNNAQFTGCHFGKVQPINYSWQWFLPISRDRFDSYYRGELHIPNKSSWDRRAQADLQIFYQ